RLRSRATRNTLAAARRCGGERRRRDLPRSRPRRVGLLAPPPWLELLSSPLGGARTPTLLALRCEAGCRERTGSPRTRIAMARAASLPPHPQQLVDRGARDRVVARPRAAVDVLRARPTPLGRNEVRVERTQELAPALRDEEPVQRGARALAAVAARAAQPLEQDLAVAGLREPEPCVQGAQPLRVVRPVQPAQEVQPFVHGPAVRL